MPQAEQADRRDLPRSSAAGGSEDVTVVAAIPAATPAAAGEVRFIGPADVQWFMDLGLRRYPRDWSPIGTEAWLRQRVLPNPASHLAIRSDHAAVVVTITYQPWTPNKFEAIVSTTMAEPGAVWELMPLLRASIEWAKRRRCVSWRIASETEYELGPLARRVGATDGKPYYMIEFPDG